MKYAFLSMTAIAAASMAAPAAAQYTPNHNYNYPTQNQNYGNSYGHNNMAWRIGQLQTRLGEGVRNGSISRREARPIGENIQRLVRLERQYSANGISGRERSALQQRIQTVRQQLRRADGGAQGRYAEWDRQDRQGWGHNNNGRIDANRDGWDDRDYNRNGRWEDDMNHGHVNHGYQQQQYQPAPRAGGIAGIIESLLGGGGGGGLQVGQRAPSNLYGVPHQYQSQYRDGNGVYYRSDGRNIYQVDARSQTVVRVIRI